MKKVFCFISALLLATASAAHTGEALADATALPTLDGSSGEGLEIECRLVKTQFAIGEPVNVWCTIRNTTDTIKPIGWHSNVGLHFCFVPGDKKTREGLLPRAYPRLDAPITIKSKGMRPGYVLFIPPHESVRMLLTHKADRPVKFKGRAVYDPLGVRGQWGGNRENGPPWKDEWVYSNEFEYEVVADEEE